MDNGGMPPDWKPSPPLPHGSYGWRHNMAISYAIEAGLLDLCRESMGAGKHRVFKMPSVDGIPLGYLSVRHSGGGTDYFLVDEIETEHLAMRENGDDT